MRVRILTETKPIHLFAQLQLLFLFVALGAHARLLIIHVEIIYMSRTMLLLGDDGAEVQDADPSRWFRRPALIGIRESHFGRFKRHLRIYSN